jgi:hypothetical protein
MNLFAQSMQLHSSATECKHSQHDTEFGLPRRVDANLVVFGDNRPMASRLRLCMAILALIWEYPLRIRGVSLAVSLQRLNLTLNKRFSRCRETSAVCHLAIISGSKATGLTN